MSNLESFIDGEVVSANMFRCTKCKEVLPRDNFSSNSSRPSGLQDWCKKCSGAAWQLYYQKNKERLNKNSEEYSRANPEQTAFFSKRRHAKEKGSVFTILPENWIPVMKQELHCPDCGIEMKWYQRVTKLRTTKKNGNAGTQGSSGSFDQIECGKGYVEGNVRLICYGCNMQKGTLRVKEWIGVLKVRLEEGTIDVIDPALVSFMEKDK
jgi:hypothetical protein